VLLHHLLPYLSSLYCQSIDLPKLTTMTASHFSPDAKHERRQLYLLCIRWYKLEESRRMRRVQVSKKCSPTVAKRGLHHCPLTETLQDINITQATSIIAISSAVILFLKHEKVDIVPISVAAWGDSRPSATMLPGQPFGPRSFASRESIESRTLSSSSLLCPDLALTCFITTPSSRVGVMVCDQTKPVSIHSSLTSMVE